MQLDKERNMNTPTDSTTEDQVTFNDYKVKDIRNPRGFTVINRLELNGEKSLRKWMNEIGFLSPKHLKKIKEKWKADSGERI